jgi:hypothetical protein
MQQDHRWDIRPFDEFGDQSEQQTIDAGDLGRVRRQDASRIGTKIRRGPPWLTIPALRVELIGLVTTEEVHEGEDRTGTVRERPDRRNLPPDRFRRFDGIGKHGWSVAGSHATPTPPQEIHRGVQHPAAAKGALEWVGWLQRQVGQRTVLRRGEAGRKEGEPVTLRAESAEHTRVLDQDRGAVPGFSRQPGKFLVHHARVEQCGHRELRMDVVGARSRRDHKAKSPQRVQERFDVQAVVLAQPVWVRVFVEQDQVDVGRARITRHAPHTGDRRRIRSWGPQSPQ